MKTLPTIHEADLRLRQATTIEECDAIRADLTAFMEKQDARRYRHRKASPRINKALDRISEAWQARDALGKGFLGFRALRLRIAKWRLNRLQARYPSTSFDLYDYIHLLAAVDNRKRRIAGPDMKDVDLTPGSGKKVVSGKVVMVGEDKDGNTVWGRVTKRGK